MINVVLHGEMGKIYGHSHRFAVKTGGEAFKALRANFKTFNEFIINGAKIGKNYMVVVDDKEVEDAAQFSNEKAEKEIHFVPVVLGAGGDGNLGFVLLAAGAILAVGGFFIGGAFGSFLTQLGISLALAGIAALLFEPPKPPNLTQTVSAGANSYFFGGRANSAQQGVVVPVGYGRLKIGSKIIRSSVRNEDLRTIEDDVDFDNN